MAAFEDYMSNPDRAENSTEALSLHSAQPLQCVATQRSPLSKEEYDGLWKKYASKDEGAEEEEYTIRQAKQAALLVQELRRMFPPTTPFELNVRPEVNYQSLFEIFQKGGRLTQKRYVRFAKVAHPFIEFDDLIDAPVALESNPGFDIFRPSRPFTSQVFTRMVEDERYLAGVEVNEDDTAGKGKERQKKCHLAKLLYDLEHVTQLIMNLEEIVGAYSQRFSPDKRDLTDLEDYFEWMSDNDPHADVPPTISALLLLDAIAFLKIMPLARMIPDFHTSSCRATCVSYKEGGFLLPWNEGDSAATTSPIPLQCPDLDKMWQTFAGQSAERMAPDQVILLWRELEKCRGPSILYTPDPNDEKRRRRWRKMFHWQIEFPRNYLVPFLSRLKFQRIQIPSSLDSHPDYSGGTAECGAGQQLTSILQGHGRS